MPFLSGVECVGTRLQTLLTIFMLCVNTNSASAAYFSTLTTCKSNAKKIKTTTTKKPRKKPKQKPDIATILKKEDDLTRLAKLIEAADLMPLLTCDANFTLFAPDNNAIYSLPAGRVEHLMISGNKAELTKLMQYHILGTKFARKKLETVPENKTLKDGIKTISGEKITIKKVEDKIFINSASIIKTIPAGNGIIHIVNEVLQPPVSR